MMLAVESARSRRWRLRGSKLGWLVLAGLHLGQVTSHSQHPGSPAAADPTAAQARQSWFASRLAAVYGDGLEVASGVAQVGDLIDAGSPRPRTPELNALIQDTRGLGEWTASIQGFTTIAQVSEAVRKGDGSALYLLTKEMSIAHVSDVVGRAVGPAAFRVLVLLGGTPVAAGLGAFAAQHLVIATVSGFLEWLWDLIEQSVVNSFKPPPRPSSDSSELDRILAAGTAALGDSLNRRFRQLQPQVNALADVPLNSQRMDRALQSAPDATGFALLDSLADLSLKTANTWSAPPSSGPVAVPYAPPTSEVPDKQFDIQVLGALIDSSTGNGHKILRGLPRNEAKNFILNSLQYTAEEYKRYIGVLREYPYDPKNPFEDRDYPGLPTTLPIRRLP